MATFVSKPNFQFNFDVVLSENELRGLHALTVYGIDKFLSNFRQQFGSSADSYISDLRNFFISVADVHNREIGLIEDTRKFYNSKGFPKESSDIRNK